MKCRKSHVLGSFGPDLFAVLARLDHGDSAKSRYRDSLCRPAGHDARGSDVDQGLAGHRSMLRRTLLEAIATATFPAVVHQYPRLERPPMQRRHFSFRRHGSGIVTPQRCSARSSHNGGGSSPPMCCSRGAADVPPTGANLWQGGPGTWLPRRVLTVARDDDHRVVPSLILPMRWSASG